MPKADAILLSDSLSADEKANLTAETYRPIIRFFFLLAGVYYAAMVAAHFGTRASPDFLKLAPTAAMASLLGFLGGARLSRPMPQLQVELGLLAMNLLILVNVLLAMHIDYDEARFAYFFVMPVIFAFASATMRQATFAITLVLVSLFRELAVHAPDLVVNYGFIAFGTAVCALAIAYYLRHAIALAVTARLEAETGRARAERMEEKARRLSLTDSLTRLPNRRAFVARLESDLAAQDEQADGTSSLWLIHLDLDDFKPVNDHYGHIVGDALLEMVGARLHRECPAGAHVSRVGGDEFNVIWPHAPGEAEVLGWCNSLIELLAKPTRVLGHAIGVSASIGCRQAVAGESSDCLMGGADQALLQAKRHHKGHAMVFGPEYAEAMMQRFIIGEALRAADLEDEMDLCLQPQIDLSTRRIVAAEVLARWHSPQLGAVGPDQFIPVAEESATITRMTLAMLNKTLAMLGILPPPVTLAMNLSGRDLLNDTVIAAIERRVADSGQSPERLEFEVTETAAMGDLDKARANLRRLAAAGHPIALDDFGTGYSNFSYLRTLPVNKLKFDRSLIADPTEVRSGQILRAMTQMARSLGIECLIEGVEDEIQLLTAQRAGINFMQGYLFAKPMDPASFREMLGRQRRGEALEARNYSGAANLPIALSR